MYKHLVFWNMELDIYYSPPEVFFMKCQTLFEQVMMIIFISH